MHQPSRILLLLLLFIPIALFAQETAGNQPKDTARVSEVSNVTGTNNPHQKRIARITKRISSLQKKIIALLSGKQKKSESRTIEIAFDSTGALQGSYPAYLFRGDVLKFNVATAKASKVTTGIQAFINSDAKEVVKKITAEQLLPVTDKVVTEADINAVKERLKKVNADYRKYQVNIIYQGKIVDKITSKGSLEFQQSYTIPETIERELLSFQLIKISEDFILRSYLVEMQKLYVDPTRYFNFLDTAKVITGTASKITKTGFYDIQKSLDVIHELSLDILMNDPKKSAYEKRVKEEKQTVINTMKAFAPVINSVINSNMEWMIGWTWITDFKLKLNPFGIQKPDGKELEDLTAKVDKYKKETTFIDRDCILCGCCPKDNKAPVLSITDTRDIYTTAFANLAKAQADLTKKLDDKKTYDAFIKSLKNPKSIPYSGSLFISNKDTIHWMRHHNAARDYEWEDKQRHPSRYCEIDEIHILVENEKNSNHVVLDENIQPYIPQSVFTANVLPALDLMQGSLKAVTGPAVGPTGTEKIDLALLGVDNFTIAENVFKWIVQNKSLLPADLLKLKNEDVKPDTLLKTDIAGPSKPREGPSIVTYALAIKTKDSKKEVLKDMQYRVYKIYKIQPFAGLVYLPFDRTTSVYDGATQTFSDKSLGRFDLVAGFKFYLFGTNIESLQRDKKKYQQMPRHGLINFKRGNNGINNLNLMLGVGTQQSALSNWFGGVGFDVIKGFSFTSGVNLYSQNRYQIQNGVVTGSSSAFNSAWYVGFTVDPIVMARTLSIFQPKLK